MQKRWIAVCAAVCILLIGVGCAPTAPADDRLRVISTVFAPYDFAQQIAGERAHCTMLVPSGAEVHTYEPTAQDMIAVQNCDVFIYIGGESDAWVEQLLDAVDTADIRLVTLMDCADTEETHNHSHGDDGDAHGVDEHIWTSPKNAVRITQKITAALSEADADGAQWYAQNAAVYIDALNALDASFAQVVQHAKRTTLVMADRFPLTHFANAYGLSYHAAFENCAENTEPTAATVAALIDTVKREQIPVVLYLEMNNGRLADTVCEATGAVKRQFHSCHNVSKAELNAGATYLSLMEQNRDVLREALG